MAEKIRKFYRSRTDRILFGICGGLGEYFSIDPVLFRLLFILLFMLHGVGFFIYIIMVFVTPQEPKSLSSAKESEKEGLGDEFNDLAEKVSEKAKEISGEIKSDNKTSGSHNFLGIIIILFGLFFLMREFLPLAWIDTDTIWALAIIGIGLYIILKK